MKIILKNEGPYNKFTFLDAAHQSDFIDGILLNITLTKDNQMIVFNRFLNTPLAVLTIQGSNFNELKDGNIVLLQNFLQEITINKKIILNVLPFDALTITDENIQMINERYRRYVSLLIHQLEEFSNFNFYICSSNQSIIYHLQQMNTKYKIGMVFIPQNLNFVDLDFYIFEIESFNNVIVQQLLDRKKEVMINLDNPNEIDVLEQHISISENKELFRRALYVITNTPKITYYFIKEQEEKEI